MRTILIHINVELDDDSVLDQADVEDAFAEALRAQGDLLPSWTIPLAEEVSS